MENLQMINFIANIFLTIGVSLFMVFVYGRSTMIDDLPFYERFIIKVALASTACSSLFNVLTLSTPHPSEILFNSSLAVVFIWAAWFHYKYFVKDGGKYKHKKHKKK